MCKLLSQHDVIERAERQRARMSTKITNYGLTRSGTGYFLAVPVWYGSSGRKRLVWHRACSSICCECISRMEWRVCPYTCQLRPVPRTGPMRFTRGCIRWACGDLTFWRLCESLVLVVGEESGVQFRTTPADDQLINLLQAVSWWGGDGVKSPPCLALT